MKVLTKTEAMDWLPRTGVECDADGDLAFRNGKNRVIAVPLPDKAYRLPYLANLLVTGVSDTPFCESLLWFTGWGVAGDVSNRVGFKLLQSMHADLRPLMEAPARLFAPNEQIEAQSLLTLAILMGWTHISSQPQENISSLTAITNSLMWFLTTTRLTCASSRL